MSTANPKFLIITDNTTFQIGVPRYIGPYRVADELERNGIQTFVIDKFYSFPQFLEFLEDFLDESFVGVGISTTFFSPPVYKESITRNTPRNERVKLYYDMGIIAPDADERKNWFQKLKIIMKSKSPNAKLFIGGAKAQFFYHKIYEDLQEIDYVAMGGVDHIFPEVIKDMIAGKEIQFKTMGNKKVIDSISHYKQKKGCPKHEWRKHWFIQKNEPLPIEIGRGCAFNCKFCNYNKRESTLKTPEDLKAELIQNYENYGVQYYQFVDDCFNDHRRKVEEVCNLILSLPFKIEWVSYARFDVAVKFPETADLMVNSGGRGFFWGVESLTPEVARRAGKGTHSDKIKEFILGFSQKHKGVCYNSASLIAGLPGETEESWRKQIEWLAETDNFNFCFSGPLGITEYNQEFDGAVIDYADYSRNPQKYGFSEINHSKNYWKHETMDRTKAVELSDWAMERFSQKAQNRKGISVDIWIYPALRALGFTPEEVEDLYFNPSVERKEELSQKARPVLAKWNENYFRDIRSLLSETKRAELTL